MRLRLHGIPINYDADPESALSSAIAARLGEYASSLASFTIVKRGIDARHRPAKLVYGVDVTFREGTDPQVPGAIPVPEPLPLSLSTGQTPLAEPPLVVGGGPAGLFAALLLADHGFRPILIERGGSVADRRGAVARFTQTREPDPETNALFGLGGAGTFSDGKLNTGINHPWLPRVLEILADCGAPKNILVDAKPHIGTDILQKVVDRLTAKISSAGGVVRTGVTAQGFTVQGRHLQRVETSAGPIDTAAAVVAIGHSARDTWQRLAEAGVTLEPKPFQLGIRVEHRQSWIDRAQYGNAAGHPALGAADYKLATRIDATPVFSFCMCPGGETIATCNEPQHLALNGMSLSSRSSAFSSSGLVVTLTPEAYGGCDLTSCLSFQRAIEHACFVAGGRNYCAPAQRLIDFAKGRPSETLPDASYRLGLENVSLDSILPEMVATPLRRALAGFDRRLRGYLHPDALALAPESRASSPIRIVRDPQSRESVAIKGLYPAGEGAGYAGGIMSSALDGLNAAKAIVEKFTSPR